MMIGSISSWEIIYSVLSGVNDEENKALGEKNSSNNRHFCWVQVVLEWCDLKGYQISFYANIFTEKPIKPTLYIYLQYHVFN